MNLGNEDESDVTLDSKRGNINATPLAQTLPFLYIFIFKTMLLTVQVNELSLTIENNMAMKMQNPLEIHRTIHINGG